MDIFINNPPAQTAPAQSVQTVQAPAQSYPAQPYAVQGYAPPAYGGYPPYGRHDGGGGFGFVLLALLGAFLFLRWNRFGGRRRRWAMMEGRGPGGQDAAGGESQGQRGWKPPRVPWARDNAAEIARERFARGEINADELGAILKGLDAE